MVGAGLAGWRPGSCVAGAGAVVDQPTATAGWHGCCCRGLARGAVSRQRLKAKAIEADLQVVSSRDAAPTRPVRSPRRAGSGGQRPRQLPLGPQQGGPNKGVRGPASGAAVPSRRGCHPVMEGCGGPLRAPPPLPRSRRAAATHAAAWRVGSVEPNRVLPSRFFARGLFSRAPEERLIELIPLRARRPLAEAASSPIPQCSGSRTPPLPAGGAGGL
jgi:hypothetical protein